MKNLQVQVIALKQQEINHKVARMATHLQRYIRPYNKKPNYLNIYTINIVPKGKLKTHQDTLDILQSRMHLCRSITNLFLIREYEVTNHFHGIVITKNKTKLLKLCSKRNYRITIEPYYVGHNEWLYYILKTNPKHIDIYSKVPPYHINNKRL